jgi:putative IMPACT (imprinted ancient) family translation regulator
LKWRLCLHVVCHFFDFQGFIGKQVPLQSGDDAGENGAGGKLLNLMIRNNIYDTVVIVCRWYGGAHLGPKRFTHIIDVATEALSAMAKTMISENSHHKDHSSQSMESRRAYDLPTNTTDSIAVAKARLHITLHIIKIQPNTT